MQTAYLDNNATTQPAPEVVQAVTAALTDDWANPSSVHRLGQRARQRVELARHQVAQLIGAKRSELIFTSGATEGCNLAIRGIMGSALTGNTLITTALEHSAVRNLAEHLEKTQNVNVVRLPVTPDGLIDMDALKATLDEHADDYPLVAIHWVNNETGVIQPVEQIGALCREREATLFVDGTQGVGKLPCDVEAMQVDALTFSGHKFHGPKGVGGLFLRTGVSAAPQIIGGPQETERRGGTENVPGVVGLGVAAELAAKAIDGPDVERVGALRDRLEQAILQAVPCAKVTAAGAPRIWTTTNIAFESLEAEAIILLLSEQGVSVAAGAACSSGSIEPSPVLLAQGVPEALAHGAIRFSLSRYTQEAEIDRAIEVVPKAVEKLRAALPVG